MPDIETTAAPESPTSTALEPAMRVPEAIFPTLPRTLAVLESNVGGNRRGLKVLVYGPPKSGRSYFLSWFPGPLYVLACGESGIEPYLDKERGDKCLSIHHGDDLLAAIQFVLSLGSKSPWRSVLIDNINLAWEDYADEWTTTLGVDEIKGGNWKKVKGPWKAMVRKLMRTNLHVGMSAWIRDLRYSQDESMPGVKGQLEMTAQDNPHVEKTVLYAPDLIFKTDFVRDAKYKPTRQHQVIFYGGRRPRAVSPADLYTGKVWQFDSSKVPPDNVWEKVIGPIIDKWEEGGVDFLGVDPDEAMNELREMEDASQNETLGRLLTLIAGQTNLAEFQKVWAAEVEPAFMGLVEERRKQVMNAKERKKTELLGVGKPVA